MNCSQAISCNQFLRKKPCVETCIFNYLLILFFWVGFHYVGVYVHVSMWVYGVVCMWLNNGTAWLYQGGYWCGILFFWIGCNYVGMCGVGVCVYWMCMCWVG